MSRCKECGSLLIGPGSYGREYCNKHTNTIMKIALRETIIIIGFLSLFLIAGALFAWIIGE